MKSLWIEEQIGDRKGVAWSQIYSTIESEYSQVIRTHQKPENRTKSPPKYIQVKKGIYRKWLRIVYPVGKPAFKLSYSDAG